MTCHLPRLSAPSVIGTLQLKQKGSNITKPFKYMLHESYLLIHAEFWSGVGYLY